MAGSSRAGTDVVWGPHVGFSDITTSTTVETLDLTSWEGQHVIIQVETDAHYIAFGADATGTMDVDAAALDTALVPMIVNVGDIVRLYVHSGWPVLYYRAINSAGTIRVIR